MISHLNKKNKPTIVDISSKKITSRMAIAQGIVEFSESTFKLIESSKTKKGEIKSIAIIAGILGAKKTSELIPLCHNIEIENINNTLNLIKKIPKEFIIVAESGIKSKTDIDKYNNVDVFNFLIGESILKSSNINDKIREFLN